MGKPAPAYPRGRIDVCGIGVGTASRKRGDKYTVPAIAGSGGCRKVRWTRAGTGKRGGVRVIYYSQLENGVIYLLVIYAKAVRGNIPAHILKTIRETLDVKP